MSSPKSVTLPQKKAKDASADRQPSTPPAVCCEKIREAAYLKWEAAACPYGDGVEFWLAVEAELKSAAQPTAAMDEHP